jgi:hypothetical protein
MPESVPATRPTARTNRKFKALVSREPATIHIPGSALLRVFGDGDSYCGLTVRDGARAPLHLRGIRGKRPAQQSGKRQGEGPN